MRMKKKNDQISEDEKKITEPALVGVRVGFAAHALRTTSSQK